MDYQAYEQLQAIRWSHLKHMRVSPRHYNWAQANDRPDSDTLRRGRAVHCLVLEPDEFESRYIPFDGVRRGKAWDEFRLAHADKTILTAAEWMKALNMAVAVKQHPAASALLSGGFKEASVTWTDDQTGLACKARLDQCGSRVVDLKTAASLDERMFAAAVVRYGYHCQLAWYLDGCAANGIRVDPEPALVAVESVPPHDVVPYRVPEPIVELGRAEYRRLLERVVECEASGRWPGRSPDEVELCLPEWAWHSNDDGLEIVMPDGEAVAV